MAADLTVAIPPGRITVIVGANACGKSTLLRAMARLLKPKEGAVLLDGESIHRMSTKQVATPPGHPPAGADRAGGHHRRRPGRRGAAIRTRAGSGSGREPTRRSITSAMLATGTLDLADRSVDELSGGQRQRVWIAMALAQGTGLMLLDEPTTYLDLAHQVEVLDLLADLNQREGRTIVLVLHDLNQACRYAHHLVAMKAGTIVAEGPPAEVITEELVGRCSTSRCRVVEDPGLGHAADRAHRPPRQRRRGVTSGDPGVRESSTEAVEPRRGGESASAAGGCISAPGAGAQVLGT